MVKGEDLNIENVFCMWKKISVDYDSCMIWREVRLLECGIIKRCFKDEVESVFSFGVGEMLVSMEKGEDIYLGEKFF